MAKAEDALKMTINAKNDIKLPQILSMRQRLMELQKQEEEIINNAQQSFLTETQHDQ